MIEFIAQILFSSLFIVGLWQCFQDEMIFENAGIWLDVIITNKNIKKPLFKCIVCMASFHGFYIYWLLLGHEVNLANIIWYIAYTFAVAGVNSLILYKYL